MGGVDEVVDGGAIVGDLVGNTGGKLVAEGSGREAQASPSHPYSHFDRSVGSEHDAVRRL